MATLVLTVLGDDRSGLVGALAGVVAKHGGNWDRSSMARLGTKFAGMVEVSIDEHRIDALVAELEPLQADGLLEITADHGPAEPDGITSGAAHWDLRLIGQDRPGIVHEIAAALATAGVSIEELQTSTSSAPMSGETMFEAEAVLVADDADIETVAGQLEAIANELMVDIDLTS